MVSAFVTIPWSTAAAQTLTGLRIEGPDSVVENSETLYNVIAVFDNGWEFDVTLSSSLSTAPGTYADIGVFGNLVALDVPKDAIETVHAMFQFGESSETADLGVTILDAPTAGFALDFDGVNDFVSVPRAEILEPAGALTIEVWVQPDSISAKNSRLVRTATHNGLGYILAWRHDFDSRIQMRLHNSNGFLECVDDVTTNTYLGAWHHIAGVYSENDNFARLYVDGILKTEVEDANFGPIEYLGGDLYFGNFPSVANEEFDGRIDEVRVWNIARSECEIRNNMHRPLFGNEQGLVGYWRFDEQQGQTVQDQSTYGNDGQRGSNNDPGGDSSDPQYILSTFDLDLPPGEFIPADLDCNGVLNVADYAVKAACFNGPQNPTPPVGCGIDKFVAADLDADNDVDMQDGALLTDLLGTP